VNFSFKTKLFLTFILYGLVLVFVTQFVVYKIEEFNIKTVSVQKASGAFHKKDIELQAHLKNIELKLNSIKDSVIFQNYLNDTNKSETANKLFLAIAGTAKNIMQLRYIDNNGIERIRIDKEYNLAKPKLISEKNLQDKSSRYYYKELMQTDEDVFWYSKLDLNVEQGQIEKPIKPVLRVGIPIFSNGKRDGMIIMNVFMKEFLHYLGISPVFDIYLFDKEGNTILDPNHQSCWGQYLGHEKLIQTEFQDQMENILSNDKYQTSDYFSHVISLENSEGIRMLVKPKKDYLQKEFKDNVYEFAFIMLGVILVSFPFAYFFSQTPLRLKEQVDKQKQEQDVLLSLFDLSDDVLIKWGSNKTLIPEYVSISISKLTGYTQTEFYTNEYSYVNCIHKDDKKQIKKEFLKALRENLYFITHEPYRIYTKGLKEKWILAHTVIVRNSDNKVTGYVGYLTDITELKTKEIMLKELSITDQLTKVYNRVHLDEILNSQHYRFKRSAEACSVVLIDIDYFKQVNDTYGHLVGDRVLIEFTQLLSHVIRKGDTLGRWGGEEFLVILPHTQKAEAVKFAEKLRVIIQNNIFSDVKHKTASFGVASFTEDITVNHVIENADKALYNAKEDGRNCVRYI